MRLLIEAKNAALTVEDGRIVAPGDRHDVAVRVPEGEVRPGLINAHEHLHRNHYGRLGDPPYPNAYVWAADIQGRFRERILRGRALPRARALRTGAWKNLLAGVTQVLHHDAWERAFEQGFPLRILNVTSADSLGMSPDLTMPSSGPFALHVAEGTDASAADEPRTLAARGLLNKRLVAVHCVGVDMAGAKMLRASNCAVVWCPSSNHFLFGCTAPPSLLRDGIDVLLGSDSLLTGAGDLLDELQFARQLGHLSDTRLVASIGETSVRRLGATLASFARGTLADLVVLKRPLPDATARDVLLVMAGGKLSVLHPDFVRPGCVRGGQFVRHGALRRWIAEDSPLSL